MKKKILKYFAFAFFLFCVLSVVDAGYQDTTITRKLMPKVFSNVTIAGRTYWSQMGYAYANGVLSYCMEPEVGLSQSIYDSYLDFNIKGLSMAQKEKLELISTYGYGYGNYTTDRYYMATQALIWEVIGYQDVFYTTGAQLQGNRIDVTAEKQNILNTIDAMWKRPSFHGVKKEIGFGTEIVLSDTHGILNTYEISSTKGVQATIVGNELRIKGTTIGDGKVVLRKKQAGKKNSFIYQKTGSQTLGSFSLQNALESYVQLEMTGGKIKLRKIDQDHNSEKPSGEATLKGAIYEVKKEDGTIVDTLTTDENGIAISKMLAFGKYLVQEKEASNGYLIDPNIYHVVVYTSQMEQDLVVELISKEKVIENEIELLKVYNDGESGIMRPEERIRFAIYNRDEILVKEVITDEKGYVSFTLPYGTYTVKQINTSPYYEKIKDFQIHVYQEKQEPIKYVLSDKLVEAKLKVIKIDKETKKRIPVAGISFRIKNLRTNEYVKQEVSYPKKEEISIFKTNENGEFTTPEALEGGSYQLEEVEAPDGYFKGDPIPFTVDETFLQEGNRIELLVENEKITGQIKIEKRGEHFQYRKTLGGLKRELVKIPLAGVSFDVTANETIFYREKTYSKGDVIASLKTDTKGEAFLNHLPLASYCIEETKTVTGYQKGNEKKCFELKLENENQPALYTYQAYNKKERKNLYFQKLKEQFVGIVNREGVYQNVSMEEIEFGLYNQKEMFFENLTLDPDTLLETITTDEKGIGMISIDLPEGIYYLKELTELENYEINSTPYVFEVKKDTEGDVLEKPIVNRIKKGEITLKKKDRETNQVLSGAEFQLQYEKQVEVPLVLSEGTFTIKQMPYGSYQIKETKAPDYYQREKEPIMGVLKDKQMHITFYNQRILIPKTSGSNHYTNVTIVVVAIFFFFVLVGSRWYVKRQRWD